MSDRPGLFHPLCGANLATLLRLFATNGAVAPRHLPRAAIALAVTLVRWPFTTVERLMVAMTRRRRAPMKAPIFIVGHLRSGTTHLHNVLSQAEEFGYISPLVAALPWDLLGIVRALEPLLARALPPERYVDRIPVNLDSPQEDSIALANMTPLSYYHGLYFPQRFRHHFYRGMFFDGCRPREIAQWRRRHIQFLEKVSLYQGGKRLLIKNPAYTGQIARLIEIWPDARFIHLYRNPYVVFPSTRHFFNTLLHELALQSYNEAPVDEVILQSYPRLMNTLLADAAKLPASRFVEVRFEDLENDPLGETERIYRTLDLPGFEQARPRFEAYLTGVRSYRKNRYRFDPETIRLVQTHWAAFIERWGYEPPVE